jgi:hypothetical protein
LHNSVEPGARRFSEAQVEELRGLYWDKQLPADEVCRLAGVSYKMLQKVFREHNIPLRTIRESKSLDLIRRFGSMQGLLDRVNELVAAGMTQGAACNLVGVWPATYRAARKDGQTR